MARSGIVQNEIRAVLDGFKMSRRRRANTIETMMRELAANVYHASQELVPLDKGPLKASGRVETKGSGEKTHSDVIYGDAEAPYAVVVHEDPTKRHGSEFNAYYAEEIASGITHARRPQEQFKFLEIAMRQQITTIRQIIKKHARRYGG